MTYPGTVPGLVPAPPPQPPPAIIYVPSGPSAYVHGFGEEQRRRTRRHFAVQPAMLDFTRRVLDQSHIPHGDDGVGVPAGGRGVGGGGSDGGFGGDGGGGGGQFAMPRVSRAIGGPIGARAGRRRTNLFI
jgi:hypothetical protein